MTGYILCQTKRTEVPFYLENISTNIYSLEELCYFLYNNLYLVDETVIREDLCRWIETELKLPALAAKLRPHLGKFADLQDFLYPIFKEINYLNYEELRSLNSRLAVLEGETLSNRKKLKGDALVQNRMYVNAIRCYRELLSYDEYKVLPEQMTDSERDFAAKVYHNLGCAYARLFQMDKALECFWTSYGMSGSREELKSYLLAFRSVKTPLEYESRLAETEADEKLKAEIDELLDHFARLPETPVYGRNIDSTLERITREYHRSTGS